MIKEQNPSAAFRKRYSSAVKEKGGIRGTKQIHPQQSKKTNTLTKVTK